MTKLDLVRAKCAFCYLIFASNEANARPEREVPSLLHIWEMRELRSPDKVIGNKGRTDLDQRPCTGVINTPISDVVSSNYGSENPAICNGG